MTVEHPIVFLVCTLTVTLQLAALYIFKYIHRREKKISQIFIAATIIAIMVFCGAIVSVLTDSDALLTTIYILSSGSIGTIEYFILHIFKVI